MVECCIAWIPRNVIIIQMSKWVVLKKCHIAQHDTSAGSLTTYLILNARLFTTQPIAILTGEEQLLLPGIYTYPFEEGLPVGLPSSVTGDHGNIEYKTSVTIYRPETADQTFGQTFTVVKPFDLSSDPALRVRIDLDF